MSIPRRGSSDRLDTSDKSELPTGKPTKATKNSKTQNNDEDRKETMATTGKIGKGKRS